MKCENLKKCEEEILSIHNPTGCIKSFKNDTFCFSMVDLLCKVSTRLEIFLTFITII